MNEGPMSKNEIRKKILDYVEFNGTDKVDLPPEILLLKLEFTRRYLARTAGSRLVTFLVLLGVVFAIKISIGGTSIWEFSWLEFCYVILETMCIACIVELKYKRVDSARRLHMVLTVKTRGRDFVANQKCFLTLNDAQRLIHSLNGQSTESHKTEVKHLIYGFYPELETGARITS